MSTRARIFSCIAAAILCPTAGAQAATPKLNHSCQIVDYSVHKPYPGAGTKLVTYRVMFAKNSAVQSFTLIRSAHNPEIDNAVLLDLEHLYGTEMVNAPPLRITSYRKRTKTFSIPDRAVDSCGRVTFFQ